MRKITRAIVMAIALCKRGKNNLETIFKSKGAEVVRLDTISKSSEDGSLLAVVYAPNIPDEDGHVAEDLKVIEESAHEFLRDFRKLDIEHDGKALTDKQAYVAESFIVGEGDKRFADWKDYDGKPVDVTGGWAVKIQIDDPELRAAYRNGDWDGVSMFGLAATEPTMERKAASQRVLDRMKRSADPEQELDMDEKELKAMFKSLGDNLVTAINEIAPSKKKEDVEDDLDPIAKAVAAIEKPEVPDDLTDAKAMDIFAKSMASYELKVKAAKGELTASDVVEMSKALTSTMPTNEEAGIEDEDSPRERELKRELFEVRKSRNTDAEGDQEDSLEAVAKSRKKGASLIAGAYNKNSGAETASSFRKVKA